VAAVEATKTQQLREFAAAYGISERTAWRWYASQGDAIFDLLDEERNCRYCREPLPEQATIRRRFCDSYCRVNHHRLKQARQQFP
jgi:hypothetical protein